jgi:anti-sigma regulatory factor (Ser/Thr protein kinase)
MGDVLLQKSFEVRGLDFDKAGDASAEVKAILTDIGMDPDIILRAGVITLEAEMNVVMYARRATVVLTLAEDALSIEVIDEGPGIPDLELAMQEGYSTASDEMREMGFGYGMGLPNIKRNSDQFLLESDVGKGTRVYSWIQLVST